MEVNLTDFKRAVSGVLKTAPPSAVSDNLAYIVIIKKGKRMTFRTLNGVVESQYEIETTGRNGFSLAVSIGDFSKFVSSLRGNTCTLECDKEENKLVVTDNNNSTATFSTREADLVPTLFDEELVEEVELPFYDFTESVKSCLWATDYRIGVLVQNSLFLLGDGKEINILGTNKLVLCNKKMNTKHNPFEVVIPYQAASALLKLPPSEIVKMEVFSTVVQFSVDNFILKSVVVGCNYPNFEENLAPSEGAKNITINREKTLEAIPTVASIEHQLSALKVNADGKQMTISRDSQKGNSSRATLECTGSAEFVVNSNFLLGILNCIKGDSVQLHVDSTKVVIDSDEDDSYRAVVALIA